MGKLSFTFIALTLSLISYQNCANDTAKLNQPSNSSAKIQGTAFGQYNVDNVTLIRHTNSGGMAPSSTLTVSFLSDGTAVTNLQIGPGRLSSPCTKSGTLDISLTNLLKESLIKAQTLLKLPTQVVIADCGGSLFEMESTGAAKYEINFDMGDCTPDQLVISDGLLKNLLDHYRSQLSCTP